MDTYGANMSALVCVYSPRTAVIIKKSEYNRAWAILQSEEGFALSVCRMTEPENMFGELK